MLSGLMLDEDGYARNPGRSNKHHGFNKPARSKESSELQLCLKDT